MLRIWKKIKRLLNLTIDNIQKIYNIIINRKGNKMSINNSEYLKKIMTLEDYTKYLDAIDFEDFGKIEKILKKYKFRMVIQ